MRRAPVALAVLALAAAAACRSPERSRACLANSAPAALVEPGPPVGAWRVASDPRDEAAKASARAERVDVRCLPARRGR